MQPELRLPMESLPPELCHIIFVQACTDGGRTGRSLALVSSYIHDASQHARLHSVHVSGRRQMFAFAALLERRPTALRQVHHLFLADHLQDDLVDYCLEYLNWYPASLVDPRQRGESRWERIAGPWAARVRELALWQRDDAYRHTVWARMVHDVLAYILELVAPTLRTLVLYVLPPTAFALVPVPLPALTALTCFFRGEMAAAPPAPAPPVVLPALRRLNLITFDWARMRHVARAAPALALLRFSNGALGITTPPAPRAPVPPPRSGRKGDALLPRALRRVLLQHRHRHRHGAADCLTLAREDGALMLQRLSDQEASEGFHPPSALRARYSSGVARYDCHDARRDWLDGAAGGDGCWAETD